MCLGAIVKGEKHLPHCIKIEAGEVVERSVSAVMRLDFLSLLLRLYCEVEQVEWWRSRVDRIE